MMRKKAIKTTLVILTRNEIEGMRALIGRIPFEACDEHFVVDFESDDGTVDFVRKRGIRIIRQEKPGRGEAFRLASREAQGKFLVFFSPDGNEDPADIPKLLDKLREGYDMVIASRFLPGSRNEEDRFLVRPRAWANLAFTFIANLLWNRGGEYVSDTINGYRAIRKSAFDELKLDAQGYAIEYQMTIRAIRKGMRIAEIPTIEGERIGGESKASSLPTGFRFLWFLLRESLTRF
jgi:glycosyltransferase involved in cell wall biosynthesis